MPVTRTPSFIPSVYPYEITVTLSTETLPSILKLPQYQVAGHHAESTIYLGGTESIQEPESPDAVSSKNDSATWNSHLLQGTTPPGKLEGRTAKENFSQGHSGSLPHGESEEDVFLPIYKEKAIYRQGKFRWSVSFGSGPIDAPPPPKSWLKLSEGDVFIRVDTDAGMQQPQAWYLTSTLSPSGLVWKAAELLRDIRYIGSDPYVLTLQNHEPSWILARSAAHPMMASRLQDSQHKLMQVEKRASGKKQGTKGKGPKGPNRR